MSRQKTTIFAYLGKGHRCRGQAFFDKCLSTFNCMAVSSYVPPVGMKMTAFDFSKVVISERDKLCCTTAFFLLPSCGRLLFIRNINFAVCHIPCLTRMVCYQHVFRLSANRDRDHQIGTCCYKIHHHSNYRDCSRIYQ